jgi:t-SNARE complex subunit (syntaxin)
LGHSHFFFSRSGSEAEQDRLQQQIRQEELSFNAAMIQERQQQFQTMERDIAQIEEIFKDLSMLVSEQGIQIGTFNET